MGQGGTPGELWLTKEPDGRHSHGCLWALQVQQALLQVLVHSAAVLCQLERAQGDGGKGWCRLCPQVGRSLHPAFPARRPLTPSQQPASAGFGGSRGLGAPQGAAVPACCQSPAGLGLRRRHPGLKEGGEPGEESTGPHARGKGVCVGGRLVAMGCKQRAGAQLPAPGTGHWRQGAFPGWDWGVGAILTRHLATTHVFSLSSSCWSFLFFRNLVA